MTVTDRIKGFLDAGPFSATINAGSTAATLPYCVISKGGLVCCSKTQEDALVISTLLNHSVRHFGAYPVGEPAAKARGGE